MKFGLEAHDCRAIPAVIRWNCGLKRQDGRTAWVDPHQMISIEATFDKAGDYVWHCHILSHEDNEMMRPYTVVSDFGLML